MTANAARPALQFLQPPSELGFARTWIAATPRSIGELLQQRHPCQHGFALVAGHEYFGHRPFWPACAPFIGEVAESLGFVRHACRLCANAGPNRGVAQLSRCVDQYIALPR